MVYILHIFYILILTYFRTSKEIGLELDHPQKKSKFKYMPQPRAFATSFAVGETG